MLPPDAPPPCPARIAGVIKRIYHQCAYSKGMFVIASLGDTRATNTKKDSSEGENTVVTTQFKFTVHAPVRVHDKVELFDAVPVSARKHGKDHHFWEYSARTAKLILQHASEFADASARSLPLAAATKSDSKVLNWAAGLHVRLSKLEEEGITRVWPAVKEDMLKLAAVPNLRTDTGLQLLKASGATEEHISMFRLASQVMSAGDGHTWYPHSEVVRKMGGNDKIVQKAIALGLLTQPRRGRLALSHIHDAEREIACMVAERMRGGGSVSACREEESDGNSSYNTGDALNPEQMSAVRTAISAPVCVWTGPPGSGKTTALSSLASRTSPNNILFLAPTGKAVVRLREVTQGAARPMTVHRWIHMRSEGGPGNEREREYHTVVVDESSMLDVLTFHALLSKLDEDAHLVLVGDTDQLPSVGPGCILRDLIDAGVPHVRLSTVYRQLQGSHLANAIEAMRADPMSIPASGPEGSDFWIEHITNRRAIATRLRELMHRYAAADGSGVLVATFRNQDVEEFGKTLRPLRRPQAWRMALAYGDRVMQTRNVYNGKDGSERLNGETGTVMDVVTDGFGDASSARFVHVQFDVDGRTEVYSDDLYGTQETYEELTMAVPITIHKAQGSQAETVIYIVPSENMFETKNLVYTAISRAQKRCIVLGSKAAFIVAINRPSLQRRTMLAEYVVDSTASATSSCAGRI